MRSSKAGALLRAAGLSLSGLPLAVLAQATDTAQQLEQQDQRIKVLERKLELQNETATAAASAAPQVKAGAGGFSLGSADGKNVLRLRGNLNVDGRYFTSFDDTANLSSGVAGTSAYNSANGFLLRKVRPYIEGTFDGKYDFRFMPDFGSGRSIILDAYLAARLQPWVAVTVGKFKAPIGLERLQTEQYNKFLELGFPSSLVPNRDLGVQFAGAILNGALSYAVGYFNGVTDGASSESNPSADTDTDNKREVAGRLFVQPFLNTDRYFLRGLGVGIAASTGSKRGSATLSTVGTVSGTTTSVVTAATSSWLPSYRSAAQQTFFSYRGDTAGTTALNEATYADGRHRRLSPQAYYYYGGLGVIAEYAETEQEVSRQVNTTTTSSASLKNKAWQLAASYLLTGEDAGYATAVNPRNSFSPGKPGWGAWEIAARYQKLDIDDAAFVGGGASFANPATAVSAATGYNLALNWYLNQNVRWTVEYDHTRFEGGAGSAAAITDRKDEQAYVTRFAVAF